MSTTLLPNSILQSGRYKVLSVLGQGGFGITYLGIQSGLERRVAIKEFYMKEFCDRDPENSRVTIGSEGARQMVERFREKFVNEARKLARLNHPHIVRVIDVFEENDTAYYVMEYAEGGSLSQKVKSAGALPVPVAVTYALEVASALDYIHEQRMNHLDIKPGNIMLNEKGETVVIDFGMSKHYDATTGSETSTTPVGISDGYAPMEQYRPGGVGEFSPQTDVYALGATLFFLITGQKPPTASDVNEDGLPVEKLTGRHASTQLIEAITRAMAPRKKERFATAKDFQSALESCTLVDPDEVEEVTVVNVQEVELRTREEAAREEAERRAREEAARKEAERKAHEEAARKEAERKAREEAERKESERKAREEAARKEAERKQPVQPAAEKEGGMGKILLGIGVAAAIGVGSYFFFSRGSEPQKDASEVTVEPEVLKVENQPVALDHGHVSKRTFVYTGEVDANGQPQGEGEAVYPKTKDCSECTFTGTFANGLPSIGDLVFTSGAKYHGTFDAEGCYNKGELTDSEGYVFKGSFKDGNPYTGTWYDPNGDVDGVLRDGKEA